MARVEAVLFDFDGTLCDSQPAFTKWHILGRQYLAEVLGLEYEFVSGEFKRIWNDGHKHYHVNSDKMIAHVCDGLGRTYSRLSNENIANLKQTLLNVYDEPVALYPDAKEVLYELMSSGIMVGIVTHATDSWTKKKREWTGIDNFLLENRPYLVSVDGPKDYRSWENGVDFYKINKKNTWIVGDNLTADANAGVMAGFARSYWLNRLNEPTWTIIRDGQKIDGVREINHLVGIIGDIGEVA